METIKIYKQADIEKFKDKDGNYTFKGNLLIYCDISADGYISAGSYIYAGSYISADGYIEAHGDIEAGGDDKEIICSYLKKGNIKRGKLIERDKKVYVTCNPSIYKPNRFYASNINYASNITLGTSINKKHHKKKGGIMSLLKSIPSRLKRMINANYKAFYKLGWVDGDLELTDKGVNAFRDFVFDHFEKELGTVAKKEVKIIKKEEEKDC